MMQQHKDVVAGVVAVCRQCRGTGGGAERCAACAGAGLFMDPSLLSAPSPHVPAGSDAKVALFAARYEAGLPLWQQGDAVDLHQPDSLRRSEVPLVLAGPDGRRLA